MNTRFTETLERPLRVLLSQELLEDHRPIPPTREFDLPRSDAHLKTAPAFGFQRILVPTDFSALSSVALAHACRLASHLGGEITILHVCPAAPHEAASTSSEEAEQKRQERLRLAEAQIQNQLAEISAGVPANAAPVHSLVCEGSPHKCIVLEALSRKTDLIVTAKHGRSAEHHLLLGKTAEFVVRNAHCPVLLVGDEGAIFPASFETA